MTLPDSYCSRERELIDGRELARYDGEPIHVLAEDEGHNLRGWEVRIKAHVEGKDDHWVIDWAEPRKSTGEPQVHAADADPEPDPDRGIHNAPHPYAEG